MSKRRSDGSLTGGTGDVNPQLLSFGGLQSDNDLTTTFKINLPVTRIPQGNKVTILEVLKVYWFMDEVSLVATTQIPYRSITAMLSTSNHGTVPSEFSQADVFASSNYTMVMFYSVNGAYATNQIKTQVTDLTDGAGHGILLGTDACWLQIISYATTKQNSVQGKLLYRFKTVGVTEYVGIVQSQQ